MRNFHYDTVLSTLEDTGVRRISLNRPDRLNAMNRALVRDLKRALDDANADDATKAIILTGEGRAFCAGDDRQEHVQPENQIEARELVEEIQDVTKAIIFGAKPVVGAINGWAVGAGFEWAINCDFPIWAESAKGFFPEVRLNLFVTGAVTSLLPALAGLNNARELLFFGEKHPANRLKEMGIAWRVVPDKELSSHAERVANNLAELPSASAHAMKRALNLSASADIARALDHETDTTVTQILDPDTTRRVRNF